MWTDSRRTSLDANRINNALWGYIVLDRRKVTHKLTCGPCSGKRSIGLALMITFKSFVQWEHITLSSFATDDAVEVEMEESQVEKAPDSSINRLTRHILARLTDQTRQSGVRRKKAHSPNSVLLDPFGMILLIMMCFVAVHVYFVVVIRGLTSTQRPRAGKIKQSIPFHNGHTRISLIHADYLIY